MSNLNWIQLVDLLDSRFELNNVVVDERFDRTIKEAVTCFADNCSNCLNWDTWTWVNKMSVTCQVPWITNWLRKSALTPACDNYFPKDYDPKNSSI